MNCESIKSQVIDWLRDYARSAKANGFVVGVSGGVDSGLVSTLCSLTALTTVCFHMPISHEENDNARNHIQWLMGKNHKTVWQWANLKLAYEAFLTCLPSMPDLAKANLQSRIRMCSLYAIANRDNLLVAGTGNKIEDFGIGFFTKYGDGAVDISPIGDLMKSEVRELARYLGVADEMVNAVPTDGLWDDGRSDESQIGTTYDELEWAMKAIENSDDGWNDVVNPTERQKEILRIYCDRHDKNQHKMQMPPICKLNKE